MNGDPPGMCLCGHMHPCAHTPYAGMPTRRDEQADLDAMYANNRQRRLRRLQLVPHHNQPRHQKGWAA